MEISLLQVCQKEPEDLIEMLKLGEAKPNTALYVEYEDHKLQGAQRDDKKLGRVLHTESCQCELYRKQCYCACRGTLEGRWRCADSTVSLNT